MCYKNRVPIVYSHLPPDAYYISFLYNTYTFLLYSHIIILIMSMYYKNVQMSLTNEYLRVFCNNFSVKLKSS